MSGNSLGLGCPGFGGNPCDSNAIEVNWQLLSEIHPNQSQIAKAYPVTTIAIVSNTQNGVL